MPYKSHRRPCCASTEAGGMPEILLTMFSSYVVDILQTIEQQADRALKITFGAQRGA